MTPDYLLDTNLCVALIRKQSGKAEQRLASHEVTAVAVSALTVAELEYGVAKSRHPKLNRSRLDQFLQPLQLLAFDDAAALSYGAARARIEARGVMIGPIDMLLAGQALALEMTLVTNNTAEFTRVEGLKIEDWTV